MRLLRLFTVAAVLALLPQGLPAFAEETAGAAPQAPVAADETLWASIKDLSMPDLIAEFIKQYPNSAHRAEAEAKLKALQGTADAVPASEQAAKLLEPAADGTAAEATATRAVSAGQPDAIDPELATGIVAELERTGCDPGTGGAYDDQAKAAVERFSAASGVKLDSSAPTPEMLSVLKLAANDVCGATVAKATVPTAPVATQPEAEKTTSIPKATGKKTKVKSRTAATSKVAKSSVRKTGAKQAKTRTRVVTKKSGKKTAGASPKKRSKSVAKASSTKVSSAPKPKKKTTSTSSASSTTQGSTVVFSSSGGGNGSGGSGSGAGGGSSGGGSAGGGSAGGGAGSGGSGGW